MIIYLEQTGRKKEQELAKIAVYTYRDRLTG